MRLHLLIAIAALFPLVAAAQNPPPHPAVPHGQDQAVSFFRQVKPILQKRCQGCHQPALQGGKLILTSYAAFKAGGGSGPSFVPGQPEHSAIMRYIVGSPPAMPKNQKPLSEEEVELIRRWIAQGAKDDTPLIKDPIDANHPPTYQHAPVISALAWSPDGKTLAVSGFREILLHRVGPPTPLLSSRERGPGGEGSSLVTRLVGKSSRINSLVYSADGRILAAVGGQPGLFGEVQFWDTQSDKPINAIEVGYDELYGASLSPDGKRLAFGGADNSVRIVSVPDGKQLLKFDNHSDWIFATAWSMLVPPPAAADKNNETTQDRTNRVGKFEETQHILSTGRDRAIKLIVAETGSFVDDINTFTSAYRCMAREPKQNHVLVAGDDGIPRLYQIFRTKPRTMNQEDHNLLKTYETQPGRVNALAYTNDGRLVAFGGEYGEIRIYNSEDGKRVAAAAGIPETTFALTFSPDGSQLAAGGLDGSVRILDSTTGKLVKEFVPVPIAGATAKAGVRVGAARQARSHP